MFLMLQRAVFWLVVGVNDDVAVDHDQSGAQPADDGEHPGEGQGARGRAQVVNSAAHQVALAKYSISC